MAIAVAQVGGNVTTSSGASISFTFGSSTTSNSAIVIVGMNFDGATAAAGHFTDGKSNTYQLGVGSNGASALGIEGGYNNAGTRGSSHSCTYAAGGSNTNNIGGIEITGQDSTTSTSCFDSTTKATNTDGTDPYSVTSAAAISGNQVAVYGVTVDGNDTKTWTPATGYTDIVNQGSGSFLVSECCYKVNETGTPSPASSWPGLNGGTGAKELFMTFKEAAASSFDPPLSVPPFQANVWRM